MDLRGHIFVSGPIVDSLWTHLIESSYRFLSGPPCLGFTIEREKERFQLQLQLQLQ